PILRRNDGPRVVDGTVLTDGVPQRKRHAEETLPADAPVAVEPVDPVLEARAHVRRMPGDALAARHQRLALVHGPDEPLTRGQNLERTIAFLEELDRVRNGARRP